MNGGRNSPDHWAGHRDPGELEGDGARMTYYAGTNPDQLELQAGQRPVGHFPGQVDATQESGRITGQCVQLQPHLVVAEALARQPRPAEGVFAFPDVLFGGAASIVEASDLIRLHGQVGDNEAHAGEQLARMPLDPGDHTAFPVP